MAFFIGFSIKGLLGRLATHDSSPGLSFLFSSSFSFVIRLSKKFHYFQEVLPFSSGEIRLLHPQGHQLLLASSNVPVKFRVPYNNRLVEPEILL